MYSSIFRLAEKHRPPASTNDCVFEPCSSSGPDLLPQQDFFIANDLKGAGLAARAVMLEKAFGFVAGSAAWTCEAAAGNNISQYENILRGSEHLKPRGPRPEASSS